MSLKCYKLPDYGLVTLYKRKGVKSIRLSVSHSGEIKVTMPIWTPYQVGLAFVRNNYDWINKHRDIKIEYLKENDRIGKAHILKFYVSDKYSQPKGRLSGNEVRIYLSNPDEWQSDTAQNLAKKYSNKALRAEAEQLLPQRLAELAAKFGFKYRSVRIKQLKSRWGSCNSFGDITLNFFLMQLPWELIDYVILHELTHTKVLAHGPKFWAELDKYLPNAKKFRKDILSYKPTIVAIPSAG